MFPGDEGTTISPYFLRPAARRAAMLMFSIATLMIMLMLTACSSPAATPTSQPPPTADAGGQTTPEAVESAASNADDAGDGDDAAADAVEQYLTAKVNSDEAGVRALLCSSMEADLPREVASFTAVTGVTLEGMDCSTSSDPGVVTCTGQIVAQYGAENTTFPLRSYRVVEEDGEWRWCGETAAP